MLRPATGRLKNFFRSFSKGRKEKVRVNFGGKLYVGFTLLVGFAAVNTGNNMLYILLSFLLALMGVSGFLSRYNLKGLKVLFYPPDEVWCCRPAPFKVRIENRKRLPSFLVEVTQKEIGLKEVFKMVERSAERETVLTFPKRGLYKLTTLEVRSSFPFGLFERSMEIDLFEEILVFPRPKEVGVVPSLSERRKSPESSKEGSRKGEETIEGLKEFSGESFSRISWKTFARLGELYVKELGGDESTFTAIVDLNSLPGDREDKISYATYLVLLYYKRGFAVGLKCFDGKLIPPSAGREHLKKLLERLALA